MSSVKKWWYENMTKLVQLEAFINSRPWGLRVPSWKINFCERFFSTFPCFLGVGRYCWLSSYDMGRVVREVEIARNWFLVFFQPHEDVWGSGQYVFFLFLLCGFYCIECRLCCRWRFWAIGGNRNWTFRMPAQCSLSQIFKLIVSTTETILNRIKVHLQLPFVAQKRHELELSVI